MTTKQVDRVLWGGAAGIVALCVLSSLPSCQCNGPGALFIKHQHDVRHEVIRDPNAPPLIDLFPNRPKREKP